MRIFAVNINFYFFIKMYLALPLGKKATEIQKKQKHCLRNSLKCTDEQ